jgi:UDP-2,4-diacetamido-2,4,6-trideoxy-beta-L-altropyranose hydrolase
VRKMRVLVLSNGGPGIGGGHISRCVALATAFDAEGLQCRWMVNESALAMLPREALVETLPEAVLFASDAVGLVRKQRPDLIVVDSYVPELSFLRELRAVAPLCVIDDCRDRPVDEVASVLLNYNLGAEELGYGTSPERSLLGLRYALLRSVFADVARQSGEYVFLSAGSADVRSVTSTFLEWWRPTFPPLVAVLGPFVPPGERERARQHARFLSHARLLVAPEEYPRLLAGAGFVLCTSSVSAYEALALEKPLAVFQVASNQCRIGGLIEQRGLGKNLGEWGTFTGEDVARVLSRKWKKPDPSVNLNGAVEVARTVRAWLEDRH